MTIEQHRKPGGLHAVLTGTSSGIGQAIAERLLDRGWRVTGLDRAAPTICNPEFSGVVLDLSDRNAITDTADGIADAHALIHAAGFMRVGEVGNLDREAGLAMWQVHVAAAETLARSLLPRMAAGGRVVLIGSRTANGAAGRSQYAATKAALTGLARSWAIELATRRITVNVVAPAATDTPFLHNPQRSGSRPILPPMGRYVSPREVAELVGYLVSAEAGAITGQTITICAGASL